MSNVDNPGPSFLDRKVIVAIVFVIAFMMAWQYYLQHKYPAAYKKTATQSETQPVLQGENKQVESQPTVSGAKPLAATVPASGTEKKETFSFPNLSFDISSKGMSLRSINMKSYTTRKGQEIEFGSESEVFPFETRLLGEKTPLDFSLKRLSDTEIQGEAQGNGFTIVKVIRVQADEYKFDVKTTVHGDLKAFQGLSTHLSEVMTPHKKSFLIPTYEHQEFISKSEGKTKRVVVGEDDMSETISKATLGVIGSQYFAMGMVSSSAVLPDFVAHTQVSQKLLTASLEYKNLGGSSTDFEVTQTWFVSPKSLNILEKISPELSDLIDFGMFGFIGKKILLLMQVFYRVLGNWGLAIIFLTLLVRLIVLPFAVMSFKSMKNMQKIQPMLKEVRERYKEDAQRMNMEVMRIMKEHKVNPLGGCLPMLLQFPVFIALYQVLGNSIDLYKAPFAFWIHDLSAKDPFYVLPVLMGVSMFMQQKVTPTTMDPAQAKVMMFMPLLFSFLMLSLPSGLTLYMLVSTIFGITQQLLLTRDKTQLVSNTERKGVTV